MRGMLCQVDRLCEENVEVTSRRNKNLQRGLEQLAEDQKDFYHWQVENGGGYRILVDEDEWKSGIHRFREFKNWSDRMNGKMTIMACITGFLLDCMFGDTV